MQIKIIKNPDTLELQRLGVENWPIWEKEVSSFPWEYDADETCYILDGRVTVTPEGGEPVEIEAGDLVTFPRGMRCTWDIHESIRKHYTFS